MCVARARCRAFLPREGAVSARGIFSRVNAPQPPDISRHHGRVKYTNPGEDASPPASRPANVAAKWVRSCPGRLRGIVPCVDGRDGNPGGPSVVGRWELQALRSIGEDGTVTGLPFGEHPHGVLIYTPGGWMAGQLAATSRAMVDDADPLGGPLDQRAAAYSTYVAYWGRYALDGERITHYVDNGLVPGWAGVEQVRYFSLSGDVLVLRTPVMLIAGVTGVTELTWRRMESW
jgi:Lipocalin-like domain